MRGRSPLGSRLLTRRSGAASATSVLAAGVQAGKQLVKGEGVMDLQRSAPAHSPAGASATATPLLPCARAPTHTPKRSRYRAIRVVAAMLMLFGWVTLSCSSGSSSKTVRVTKGQFGDEWPFAVTEATIECRRGDVILLRTGQRTYGLNGAAVDAGYDSIRYSSIWLDDPGYQPGSGIKIALGPLIGWAVDFCGSST